MWKFYSCFALLLACATAANAQKKSELAHRITTLEAEVRAIEGDLVKARTENQQIAAALADALRRIEELEKRSAGGGAKYSEMTLGGGSQLPAKPTLIEFDEQGFDFGSVNDRDTVEHVFTFTNTGKEPLVIERAYGSCGCTIPEWSKEPIAPNAKGSIKVKFDPTDKKGRYQKYVTIVANTIPSQNVLYIKADVK